MSAFITLLLNDAYLSGAQVLGHSLRDLETVHELAILVTPNISDRSRAGLAEIFDHIITVDPISNPSTDNLNLLGRLDLRASLTKLHLWHQVQFEKLVFLDADTIVLQNIDHLFDLDVEFAAAPDIGWPDIFNSGVFFTKPNAGTYAALRRLADNAVSFDGGDQGLLNTFFPSFARLSFTYNVTPSAGYQYIPAYRYFESQIKVAHFIGAKKPWHHEATHLGSKSEPYAELLARWWAVYERHYPSHGQALHSSGKRSITRSESASPPGKSPSPLPFEAPDVAWNAQTSPPPTDGLPEAAELRFLTSSNDWQASGNFVPPSTPKIPKFVHFEPPAVPDPSKQIFPWEGRSVAQRSFPEDAIAPLQEIYTIERNPTPQSDSEEAEPHESFQEYRFSNAWDSVQQIRNYMAAVPGASSRPRAPSSTWGSGSNTPREAEMPEGRTPQAPSTSSSIPGSQKGTTTDFLMQEPAGIPRPQDWNPSAQLEALASQAASLARDAAARKAQSTTKGSGSSTPVSKSTN